MRAAKIKARRFMSLPPSESASRGALHHRTSAHQLQPNLSHPRATRLRVERTQQLRLHQRELGHPGVGLDRDEERTVLSHRDRFGDLRDLSANEQIPLRNHRRLLDAIFELRLPEISADDFAEWLGLALFFV